MTNPGDTVSNTDRALEQLLERAEPRPTPSAEAAQLAKHAVREEWNTVTRRRVGRRRTMVFATAATIALGVALTFADDVVIINTLGGAIHTATFFIPVDVPLPENGVDFS